MDAAEKWERLKNPKTVADWQLSLTQEEMAEVPELSCFTSFQDEMVAETLQALGKNARDAIERVSYGVLRRI